MPFHIHPVLRSLGEVLEAEGLAITQDSEGVRLMKAAESASSIIRLVPVADTRYFRNGKKYTSSSSGQVAV